MAGQPHGLTHYVCRLLPPFMPADKGFRIFTGFSKYRQAMGQEGVFTVFS